MQSLTTDKSCAFGRPSVGKLCPPGLLTVCEEFKLLKVHYRPGDRDMADYTQLWAVLIIALILCNLHWMALGLHCMVCVHSLAHAELAS